MATHGNAIPEEALRRAQELLSKWQISPDFLAGIMERRLPVTFTRGEAIFTQGSAADVAFWVLSGLVKVYFPLPDGTRVIVRVAGAGDFIGMVDSIGNNGRHVQALEAEAMTKVAVAIFTRDHVLAMLKAMPAPELIALLQVINTTWSEVFSWCARFLGLSFRERLRSVFELLGSRYGVRESRGVLLTPELSHDDLAEMIASSRPMVSRLIAEFIEQGELARQGRHYILINAAPANSARPLPQAARNNRGAAREHPLARVDSIANRPGMRAPISIGADGDSPRLRAANGEILPGREYVK
jgi:CRP/FNR family cyclic AMP-dependent transcriptional regulator